jgi:hypothetical protein
VSFLSVARGIVVKFSPIIPIAFLVGWWRHDIVGEVIGSMIMIVIIALIYWLSLRFKDQHRNDSKQ